MIVLDIVLDEVLIVLIKLPFAPLIVGFFRWVVDPAVAYLASLGHNVHACASKIISLGTLVGWRESFLSLRLSDQVVRLLSAWRVGVS